MAKLGESKTVYLVHTQGTHPFIGRTDLVGMTTNMGKAMGATAGVGQGIKENTHNRVAELMKGSTTTLSKHTMLGNGMVNPKGKLLITIDDKGDPTYHENATHFVPRHAEVYDMDEESGLRVGGGKTMIGEMN